MNAPLSDTHSSASSLPYCGRFAPSPTGPLHLGSLVAALGSCLAARSRGGRWLVRMEDVDQPRCMPGAAEDILATLESHGFVWDGPVLWQSTRLEAYRDALGLLRQQERLYPCCCSRKAIADSGALPGVDGGLRYPGTCRPALPAKSTATPENSAAGVRAWRYWVSGEVAYTDELQGPQCQSLETAVGDFVLFRADGQFSYQLAVVVDDAFQGITHVVRGADLLASTPRQIALQQALGYPQPIYAHLPLVLDGAGDKLSKQTRAPALDPARAAANLVQALGFLGQQPPPELAQAAVGEVWQWALAHWDLLRIPGPLARQGKPVLPG